MSMENVPILTQPGSVMYFGSVASVVCMAMVILVWYSFTAVNPGMSIRPCAQECWHHPREGAVVESGEEP